MIGGLAAALIPAALGLGLVSQAIPDPSAPPAVVAGAPAAAPASSIWAPPRLRETTRVELEVSPFLGLTANSFGTIGQARIEHYFAAPFMVGVELAPFAFAASGEGPGAIVQARLHGAYVNDYFAIGLGLGGQLQRFGRNGLSIAPTLRLGSLDGLHASIEYAYSVAPNMYTGQRTVGFSSVLGELAVPLTRRLTLEMKGGLNLNAWIYSAFGLRHRLIGDGGPGSWFVSGAFGAAWISDRNGCDFSSDTPCGASALTFGPTITFGVEHRF